MMSKDAAVLLLSRAGNNPQDQAAKKAAGFQGATS